MPIVDPFFPINCNTMMDPKFSLFLTVAAACLLALSLELSGVSPERFSAERPSTTTIASVMKDPVDVDAWLEHHRRLGVSSFYIRLEDSSNEMFDRLSRQTDVMLERGTSGVDNYTSLMDRQIDFVNHVLDEAPRGCVVFAIDSDELLAGSFRFLRAALADGRTSFKLENAEAVYDGTEKACFETKKFRPCWAGAKCRSYGNGKAGGVAGAEGVSCIGPHDFSGPAPFHVPFDELAVLHFDSCSFASWVGKFHNLIGSDKSAIPFDYYRDSLTIVELAKQTYLKHVMPHPDEELLTIDPSPPPPPPRAAPPKFESMAPWLAYVSLVCINLDKNADRWSNVLASYEASDLPKRAVALQRFPAYVGAAIPVGFELVSEAAWDDVRLLESKGVRTHHHQLTRGAIGCFLSHWAVYMQLARDKKADAYVVLEDDAVLHAEIGERLARFDVPEDWDLLLLGTIRLNRGAKVSHEIVRVKSFWGTHGYVVNKRAARKLSEAFGEDKIDAQIDARISYMIQRGGLNVYATKEQLVLVSEIVTFPTDIQLPINETDESFVYRGVFV